MHQIVKQIWTDFEILPRVSKEILARQIIRQEAIAAPFAPIPVLQAAQYDQQKNQCRRMKYSRLCHYH